MNDRAKYLFQRGVTEQQADEITAHRASRHRLTSTVRKSIHILRAQGLGDVADQFEAVLKEDESNFVGSLDTLPDSWAQIGQILAARGINTDALTGKEAR